MKIGEVAAKSGVSAKMVRYYESIGLIRAAQRSSKGYRGYDEADVHTLKFVRRCRDLGFNMDEIGNLLALWKNRRRKSSEVKRLASLHVGQLQAKIDALQSMVNTLAHLMHCCHGDERPECPILDELEGPNVSH
jgi:MerR family transcriptional regulator, copper efflux regulator